jgi:hypothetical protein
MTPVSYDEPKFVLTPDLLREATLHLQSGQPLVFPSDVRITISGDYADNGLWTTAGSPSTIYSAPYNHRWTQTTAWDTTVTPISGEDLRAVQKLLRDSQPTYRVTPDGSLEQVE